ncbi:MAG: serine protease [Ruminococcus sp.]|nr:serine protease [Ruminococcus sp.]
MKSKKMIASLSALSLMCSSAAGYIASAVDTPIEPTDILGDVNNDGRFNLSDLVLMHRYLLRRGTLANYYNADFDRDDCIDSFDLCLMQKDLIKRMVIPSPIFKSRNLCSTYTPDDVEGLEADDEFIKSQTEFALGFLQRSITASSNTMVSPYSAIQALAMTANGTGTETRAEMEKVLGGGMSIDKLNKYLYTQRINQPDGSTYSCKLKTANAIWSKKGLPVAPEFLKNNVNYYGADFYEANMDKSTVDDINSWVNKNTDKMIPKLIDELSESTVMCLVNAVTFDADWISPFDPAWDGTFVNANGENEKAKMMTSDESYYITDGKAQGFMKMYEGRKYAFAALLPDEGVDLNDYISGLTAESLNKTLSNPETEGGVHITLPKFKYDFEIHMNDLLKDMGMNAAFDDTLSDFSKMVSNGGDDIYISDVLQKTHIEVDEKGTRAAAATSVTCDVKALPPSKEIKFDRPFMYCIIDTETSIPVFIGTVMTLQSE